MLRAMEEKSMLKRHRVSHPETAWEDLSRSTLRRNGFANKTGAMRRGTKKQMENVTERQNGIKNDTDNGKRERKKEKSEREREREVYCYFGITLYLHAQPRTLSSLRSNQIPTFAICAWMPLATSAFTAPSAAIGDSKSTNP